MLDEKYTRIYGDLFAAYGDVLRPQSFGDVPPEAVAALQHRIRSTIESISDRYAAMGLPRIDVDAKSFLLINFLDMVAFPISYHDAGGEYLQYGIHRDIERIASNAASQARLLGSESISAHEVLEATTRLWDSLELTTAIVWGARRRSRASVAVASSGAPTASPAVPPVPADVPGSDEDVRNAANMQASISTFVATAALGVLAAEAALAAFYMEHREILPWANYALVAVATCVILSMVFGGLGVNKLSSNGWYGDWNIFEGVSTLFNIQATLTVLAASILIVVALFGTHSDPKAEAREAQLKSTSDAAVKFTKEMEVLLRSQSRTSAPVAPGRP